MFNHPSQGWDRPWSPNQPAPWVTRPDSPEIPVAQLRPRGHSYAEEYGAIYESMVVDGSEVYLPTAPETFMNNPYNGGEARMEIDVPTIPSDPMDIDSVATEASYPQATEAGPSSGYYFREPRTPRRRPLGRAVTTGISVGEPFSPTKSLARTRSYAVLTAVTNTPKRNPTAPYTPQRTQRKPSAPHPVLEPRQHDGSPYCPPTTPRRKRRVGDPDIDPLFNELLEYEIDLLTLRFADLRIFCNLTTGATNWSTASDFASYLSVAGSDATAVSSVERFAHKDGEDEEFDAALEFLRDVMKDVRQH